MSYNYSVTSALLNATFSSNRSSGISSSSLATTDAYTSLLNMYYNINSSSSSGLSSSTASAAAYVAKLQNDGDNLKTSLSSLMTSGSGSVYSQVSLASDSSAVSVSYTGSDKPEDFTVDVTQAAAAQENAGTALKANATASGASSLTITSSDGEKHSFYVSSSYSATNAEVQEKLAEKINNAKIGITASIKTDENKGTSQLVLTAKNSGADSAFSVSGELAQSMGISKATTAAQDAVYSINGGAEQTSSTNKIKLSDDLTLNIKGKTSKTANISYSKNSLEAINSAREMVNNINGLLNAAKESKDKSSEKLESLISSTIKTYASGLADIGITTGENGYLKIDETKMKTAAESGELEKFFTSDAGKNYGFANRMSRIADQTKNEPTRFLSTEAKHNLNASEKGYDITKSSGYIQSYYKLSSASMLLNLFS